MKIARWYSAKDVCHLWPALGPFEITSSRSAKSLTLNALSRTTKTPFARIIAEPFGGSMVSAPAEYSARSGLRV